MQFVEKLDTKKKRETKSPKSQECLIAEIFKFRLSHKIFL